MPYVFLKGGREGAQAVWNSRQLEWQGKRLKNGMVHSIIAANHSERAELGLLFI